MVDLSARTVAKQLQNIAKAHTFLIYLCLSDDEFTEQQMHTKSLPLPHTHIGSHSKTCPLLRITTDEMLSLINTSLSSSSLAEESHCSSRGP